MTRPNQAQPKRSHDMQQLLSEQYLIKRLKDHGREIDTGVTTPVERRERMREAIRAVGPQVIVGRGQDGRGMTYQDAFERLFKVPFEIKEDAA